MREGLPLELSRDCDALQIPAGNTVVLPAATAVYLTQARGGSFTVRALGALFQIAGQDADALGLTPEAATPVPPPQPGQQADEKTVWDALRTCFDPEIPVNIVDLGLVYDLELEHLPEGGSKAFVRMTLTAPGCGMGPAIARDAQDKILTVPGMVDAAVEVVWDPPWHQSMISPEGRRVLGLD